MLQILISFCLSADNKELYIEALRETAYAYYRRGNSIQYDGSRKNPFTSPETISIQNRSFSVCSSFVYAVYYDAFQMHLPRPSKFIAAYAKHLVEKSTEEGIDKRQKGVIFFSDNFNNHIDEIGQSAFVQSQINEMNAGDIVNTSPGIDGHSMFVYDFVYDNGNRIDALIIHSTSDFQKGENQATKLSNDTLSFNNETNKGYQKGGIVYYSPTGINEGTIQMTTFSKMVKLYKANKYFSILRPLLDYSSNKYIEPTTSAKSSLTVEETIVETKESTYNITDNAMNRLKYKGIEIEKTVDVFNDNTVFFNDTLTYFIRIKNNNNLSYENLQVEELSSEYVTIKDKGQAAVDANKLTWNINIGPGEEKILSYSVTVNNNKNNLHKNVVSCGTVGGISSGSISNNISRSLNEYEKQRLLESYHKNKMENGGLSLMDKIYNDVFKINLNLSSLVLYRRKLTEGDDRKVIINNLESKKSVSLNYDSDYAKLVYNNYYGGLYKYPTKEEWQIPLFEQGNWPDTTRHPRKDYLYDEHFQMGDILIYHNENDTFAKDNGLFCYMYMNESFRNVSDAVYSSFSVRDIIGNGNNFLQTLIAKDDYVILRPGQILGDFLVNPAAAEQTQEESNNNKTTYIVIAVVVVVIIIIAIIAGIVIYKKTKCKCRENQDESISLDA